MMLVIAGIGFYSIRDHSVDMNCLMTWGMICLVNGVGALFDKRPFRGHELPHDVWDDLPGERG